MADTHLPHNDRRVNLSPLVHILAFNSNQKLPQSIMPDVLKSSLHGIVMPPGLNFDGSDATKYPLLLWNMRSTDTVLTYLVKNQRLYAEKDAEKQLPTNPLNAATIQGGYIAGDNALRAYVAAQKMNDNEKFLVCAIIMRGV